MTLITNHLRYILSIFIRISFSKLLSMRIRLRKRTLLIKGICLLRFELWH